MIFNIKHHHIKRRWLSVEGRSLHTHTHTQTQCAVPVEYTTLFYTSLNPRIENEL